MMGRTELILGLALLWPMAGSGQDAPRGDGSVVVRGEVSQPVRLTAADLAAMPRKVVKARDHGGV
jgi:hypothetical protein